MEQIFLNEVCKFYARNSKGTKAVPVYANIKVYGNRFVIPVNVKVIPNQFDVKKQKAITSNLQSDLDNMNNQIVNDTIKNYMVKFNDYIHYLMNNPDEIANIKENIFNFVPSKKKRTEMKKKFTDTLEYIFNKEFERQINEHKITELWAVTKKSNIKKFIDFLSIKKLPDTWSDLNATIYNDYKDYLLNEYTTNKGKLKISAINQALSTLKAITNAVSDRNYKELPPIETGRWKLADNKLTRSEKKSSNVVFEKAELQKIIDLKLTGTEEIVRDLFVFGAYIGQRPADCVRLLNGEGKRMISNNIEVLQFVPHKTKKTDLPATIPLYDVEEVDNLIKKFNTIEEYKAFMNKTDVQRNSLNSKYIKGIFQKAGIDDEIEVTEQRGTEVIKRTTKQAEEAHIYLSRHYYITQCFIDGMSAEKVIQITGHTTAKQVNETYEHLNSQQRADIFTADTTIQKLAGKEPKTIKKETKTDDNETLQMILKKLQKLEGKEEFDAEKERMKSMYDSDDFSETDINIDEL